MGYSAATVWRTLQSRFDLQGRLLSHAMGGRWVQPQDVRNAGKRYREVLPDQRRGESLTSWRVQWQQLLSKLKRGALIRFQGGGRLQDSQKPGQLRS